MKREKLLLYLSVALALSVLTVSYIYLAFYHGVLFLFNTVVHENGMQTLLQTIFTFDHVIGQLPMIITFSFFITGSFLLYSSKVKIPQVKEKFMFFLILSILLLSVVFLGSILFAGWDESIRVLLQYRENPQVYTYGGNWKMMLPSNIVLFFVTLALPYLLRLFIGDKNYENRFGLYYVFSGIVITILLSIIFLVDFSIFTKPRWLAHAVREIMTNSLITLPLTFSVLVFVESKYKRAEKFREFRIFPYVWAAIAVLLTFFILVSLVNRDIGGLAQAPDFAKNGSLPIVYLAAFHFFEHIIDYVLIILLSLTLYFFADWQGD